MAGPEPRRRVLDNFDFLVAEVNELMPLCDALEATLTQSRADAVENLQLIANDR
jgi:hypothetical protein